MSKSLAVIVDTETEEVVWYAVADDEVAEDLLDEAAEKHKTKTEDDDVTDLADELWVEDEKYDYTVIPLDEGETPESVFKQMGWKTKSKKD